MKKLLLYGLLLFASANIEALGPYWETRELNYPDGRKRKVDSLVVNNAAGGQCSQLDLILRDKNNPEIIKGPYWNDKNSGLNETNSLRLQAYFVDNNGKRSGRGTVYMVEKGTIVNNKVPVLFDNNPNGHYRIDCLKTANGREDYINCSDVVFYTDLKGPFYYCTSGRNPRHFDPLGLGTHWTPKK